MTTKQEQIADFLISNGFGPPGNDFLSYRLALPSPLHWYIGPPTVEDLGQALFDTAGFRALQLGNLFSTTEGAVILEAVKIVLPPAYRAEIALLAKALIYAAKLQQRYGQRFAGRVAVGVLASALVLIAFGGGAGRR
jgi:hypothetical protein